MQKILVYTFKKSGKYYDEFEIEIENHENKTWYEIMEEIRWIRKERTASMDWLIGFDNSRSDMYPIILKG